jgi:hypothetical protein
MELNLSVDHYVLRAAMFYKVLRIYSKVRRTVICTGNLFTHRTAQFYLERAYIILPTADPVAFITYPRPVVRGINCQGMNYCIARTHARTRHNASVSAARSRVKPGAVPTGRSAYNKLHITQSKNSNPKLPLTHLNYMKPLCICS